MYLLSSVLDEFPAPPGSAYPGARPGQSGQPGSEQDQRTYGQAAGTRPYGQDQRPGITPSRFAFLFVGRDFDNHQRPQPDAQTLPSCSQQAQGLVSCIGPISAWMYCTSI